MKKIVYNWEVLAVTRFILAMIVLFSHLPAMLLNDLSKPWYSKFGAFEAVLGFLLISGLSIGKSIQKNQDSYFKRRLHRIYPVYLVCIILHYIVMQDPVTVKFIILIVLNLVFLNQVFTSVSYIPVAWSLSLEVWLYALAPSLYKLSFKWLMVIVYCSFIVFLIQMAGRSLFNWPYFAGLPAGIDLVLLAFIWIAGFVYSLHPDKRTFIARVVGGIFIIYMGFAILIELAHLYKHHKLGEFLGNQSTYFIFRIITLTTVYFVVFFNHKIAGLQAGTKKIFNILGNISYPLYLIHCTIFIFLNKHKLNNMALAIVIALVVAYLIYILFDFYSKKREQVKVTPGLT